MRNVESRIKALEDKHNQQKHGYVFIVMQPGESEGQALQRATQNGWLPNGSVPFFCTEADAAL